MFAKGRLKLSSYLTKRCGTPFRKVLREKRAEKKGEPQPAAATTTEDKCWRYEKLPLKIARCGSVVYGRPDRMTGEGGPAEMEGPASCLVIANFEPVD